MNEFKVGDQVLCDYLGDGVYYIREIITEPPIPLRNWDTGVLYLLGESMEDTSFAWVPRNLILGAGK